MRFRFKTTMDKKRADILLMVAIFTLTLLVRAQCEKPDVAAAMTSLLRAKHAMAQEMSSMKKDGVVSLRPGQRFTKLLGISKAKGKKGLEELTANERARYKTFVDKLQVLKQRVKEFYDAQRVSSIDVSDTKRINALKIYTRHDM